MQKYGPTSRVAQFIARTIPKRGSGKYGELFAIHAADILQRLDALELRNARLSVSVYADSMRAFYDGQILFYMMPSQGHIRVALSTNWGNPGSKYLLKCITDAAKSGTHFQTPLHNGTDRQWRADHDDLVKFCQFVGKLEGPSRSQGVSDDDHPRYFPSEVRKEAFEQFARSGYRCPGYARKPHRLEELKGKSRIEFAHFHFDHILPYSKGGASTKWNIQVLCSECNLRKKDKVG